MSLTRNDDKSIPFSQWEEVDVTFPAVANTDIEVPHSLTPPTAEGIYYFPVRQAQAAVVYHDVAFSRKPWQTGQIYLRANVANAKVTLMLYVPRTPKVLNF